jgi:predicted transcriptional regulator
MASPKDNSPTSSDSDEKQHQQSMQFRILDKLYAKSKGYKYAYIPFDSLYEELQANDDKKQELVRKSFEDLRSTGLVDSKAIGYASITNEGMKEYEGTILRYPESSTHFPLDVIQEVFKESRKNEIKTIQSQRDAFLTEVYKLSKGSPKRHLNAFKIMSSSNYDKETIERIYFYLVDEGLIKPFATGGELTITPKGIERVKKGK